MTRSRPTRSGQRPDHSSLDPLVLDLVEWVERLPRSYAEVMEAWRTSCPRLTVWEDAVDRGLVVRERGRVVPTEAGRALLKQMRPKQNGRLLPETARLLPAVRG
ncbi:hypothetical protein [Bradyrhizobium sp. WD16]|uniref:hypothetical protein n=1 Tax=Bradyrhizobium sp. WD16 TaxID=1521768 RepID=UPI0020A5D99B|nr:hypothetical protein [Bradyrhizobium sp. WD16]UTD27290.1 hypothetical protein DB459_10480 [Bradyrhizobium sp. WD16]